MEEKKNTSLQELLREEMSKELYSGISSKEAFLKGFLKGCYYSSQKFDIFKVSPKIGSKIVLYGKLRMMGSDANGNPFLKDNHLFGLFEALEEGKFERIYGTNFHKDDIIEFWSYVDDNEAFKDLLG